jgi:hypothetical protein
MEAIKSIETLSTRIPEDTNQQHSVTTSIPAFYVTPKVVIYENDQKDATV